MKYENGKFKFDEDPNADALKLMRVVWSEFTTPRLPRRSKPPPEKFVKEINFAKREMNLLWMIYFVTGGEDIHYHTRTR